MKIEFVKETKINGEAMYYTRVNGCYADKSLTFDLNESKAIYNNIVKNKGKYVDTEILESVEVVES